MGRAYYYFSASLPMIEWEGKLPMSSDEFLLECRRLLTEEDTALIQKVLGENDSVTKTGNGTVDAWNQFNRNFRNEIAWFRAKRANKDPLGSIRGDKESEPYLREIIHQAAKMKNLLEAEKILDGACWQFLNDLENGHYYDFEYLIVYGLKLKILEKYQKYNSPKGKTTFDEIRMAELSENCIVETS